MKKRANDMINNIIYKWLKATVTISYRLLSLLSSSNAWAAFALTQSNQAVYNQLNRKESPNNITDDHRQLQNSIDVLDMNEAAVDTFAFASYEGRYWSRDVVLLLPFLTALILQ